MNRMSKKSLTAVLGILAIAASAAVVTALPDGEVLYLADSHTGAHPGDNHTHLYRVFIDSAAGVATLVALPNGDIPYNQVDALAATPDGARLYAVDRYTIGLAPTADNYGTGLLGYYDVADHSFHTIDYVRHNGDVVPGVVLAAFSPWGTLYVASQDTNLVYSVHLDTAVATVIGPVFNTDTNVQVNILGADFAFDMDGFMFLWTNGANPGNPAGAPRGLYRMVIPAVPGPIQATFIGGPQDDFFTGLAVRANGFGDIVGSANGDNTIHIQSKTTGADINGSPYPMMFNGAPYDYRFGDMTNGMLGGFCTRTIGYYKTHAWPLGVTVCGVPVDETYGKQILWGANARNFSMLFAQLIAAKLNTGNAAGVDFISAAEEWLCDQDVVLPSDQLDWQKNFATRQDRATANAHKDVLDAFNNDNHCN